MPQLNASKPIVGQNGTMEPQMREQMLRLGNWLPLIGTGSPEGVVTAPQYSAYINAAGASGSILYLKMQPSIAGDKSQGWVAV